MDEKAATRQTSGGPSSSKRTKVAPPSPGASSLSSSSSAYSSAASSQVSSSELLPLERRIFLVVDDPHSLPSESEKGTPATIISREQARHLMYKKKKALISKHADFDEAYVVIVGTGLRHLTHFESKDTEHVLEEFRSYFESQGKANRSGVILLGKTDVASDKPYLLPFFESNRIRTTPPEHFWLELSDLKNSPAIPHDKLPIPEHVNTAKILLWFLALTTTIMFCWWLFELIETKALELRRISKVVQQAPPSQFKDEMLKVLHEYPADYQWAPTVPQKLPYEPTHYDLPSKKKGQIPHRPKKAKLGGVKEAAIWDRNLTCPKEDATGFHGSHFKLLPTCPSPVYLPNDHTYTVNHLKGLDMEFDIPKPPQPPKIVTTTASGKLKPRRFEPQIVQKPKFQRIKKSSSSSSFKTPKKITTPPPLEDNWAAKKITVPPPTLEEEILTEGVRHHQEPTHFEHSIPVTGGSGHQEPQPEHLLKTRPAQRSFEPIAKDYYGAKSREEILVDEKEVPHAIFFGPEPHPSVQRKVVYFGPEPQPQSVFLGSQPQPHPHVHTQQQPYKPFPHRHQLHQQQQQKQKPQPAYFGPEPLYQQQKQQQYQQQPVYYGPEPESKTFYDSTKEKLEDLKDATKEKLTEVKEKLVGGREEPPLTKEDKERFVVVEKKPSIFSSPKEEKQRLYEPSLLEKTKEKIIDMKDATKEKLIDMKEKIIGETKPTTTTTTPITKEKEQLQQQQQPSLYEKTKEKLVDAKEKVIETKDRLFKPSEPERMSQERGGGEEEPLTWHSSQNGHETIHIHQVLRFPEDSDERDWAEFEQNQHLKDQIQQLKKKNAERSSQYQLLKEEFSYPKQGEGMLRDQVIRIHFEGKGGKDTLMNKHHPQQQEPKKGKEDKKAKDAHLHKDKRIKEDKKAKHHKK